MSLCLVSLAAGRRPRRLLRRQVQRASFDGPSYKVAGTLLNELKLISLALGIDVAFVSTHHLVRVVFMVIVAPLIFHFIDGRWGLREDPNDHKF